jgi:hypothetical protein
MKQFTGSDTYWDHALAAERGSREPTDGKTDPDRSKRSGER